MNNINNMLIIGQIPPPYLGQALMIKQTLDINYQNINVQHIDLRFSSDAGEMCKFNYRKFYQLFLTILLTYKYIITHKCECLYYCPSGHRVFAILRDAIILFFIRRFFKKTIFHFHAYGVSNAIEKLPNNLQNFIKNIFLKPDIFIKLTNYTHYDERLLKPLKVTVLANGIPDPVKKISITKKKCVNEINLLYIGAIYEERGINYIIKAFKGIKTDKRIVLNFVGNFIDKNYEIYVKNELKDINNSKKVIFHGELRDENKWKIYQLSDILLFPSLVPSETFGLVIIEAMAFKIPSIVTNINGPSYVVDHNENGLLFPSRDINEFICCLELLVNNDTLRLRLGENGRKKFQKNYLLEIYERNFLNILYNA